MSTEENVSLATNNGEERNAADLPKYKVAIVAPTCRYYQVPLFQKLAADPRIDLDVYFCSKEALNSQDVKKQFYADDKWGVEEDLIKGYKHKFLRNFSPFPSYLKAGIGLINLGIWGEIKRAKPHSVVLMAWVNPTWFIAILACVTSGIPFFFMTDANFQAERLKGKWRIRIKRLLLGRLLFRLTSGFLHSGTANALLYKYYGVPDEKLIPFAYSWGHDPLLRISSALRAQKTQIKAKLGIPENKKVILYCGRLHEEKRPFLLLEAYHRLESEDKALIFVGDGTLKDSLKEHVKANNIKSVHFFGFQNRNAIPDFYAISDLLVLPSYRESWGIVVNEALCFGLPVIVSDQVGAADDLVFPGYNGFIFPEGDVDELASKVEQIMELPEADRREMGVRSLALIEKWAERDLGGSLVGYLDAFYSADKRKRRKLA